MSSRLNPIPIAIGLLVAVLTILCTVACWQISNSIVDKTQRAELEISANALIQSLHTHMSELEAEITLEIGPSTLNAQLSEDQFAKLTQHILSPICIETRTKDGALLTQRCTEDAKFHSLTLTPSLLAPLMASFETKRVSYSEAYSREIGATAQSELFIDAYIPLPQRSNVVAVVVFKTSDWVNKVLALSLNNNIDKNQSYEILDEDHQTISTNNTEPIVHAPNLAVVLPFEQGATKFYLRASWLATPSAQILLLQGFATLITAALTIVSSMLVISSITRRKATAKLKALQDKAGLDARSITLGEMSTAIAHELNQPLGAIHNYASGCIKLLAASGDQTHEITNALEEIKSQSLRGSLIIKSIREFVKRENTAPELFDVSLAIEDIKPLIEIYAKKSQSKLSIEYNKDVFVSMNKALFEQVILNISKNGFESMQNAHHAQRLLEIKVRKEALEFNNGQLAATIAFKDCGCGIKAELEDKLFKPFVSTKDDGMGVGLSFCQSIVERQGGRITWDRNPEGGTTFYLNLPITNLEVAA